MALNPNNYLADNEYAYLLMKKANQSPGTSQAPDLIKNGTEILLGSIAKRGSIDPYPFHILGSQSLAWSRRGITSIEKKKEYLERIQKMLEDGCKKHPRNLELETICQQIKREYLSIAIS